MRHKMTCSFFRHWPSLRLTQTELIIRNSAVRNEITRTWNWDSLPSCHNEADELSSVTAHGQSLHQKVLISRKRRRCYKPLTESGKCWLCKTCGTASFPTTFSDLQGHSPKPFCYAIFFVYNNGTCSSWQNFGRHMARRAGRLQWLSFLYCWLPNAAKSYTLLCKHSGTVVGLKISTRRSTVIIWRQRQSHQLQTQILRLRDNDLAYVLLHSGQEIKPESARKAPCGRRRRPVFTCKVLSSFTTRATRSKYLLPAHTGITLRARRATGAFENVIRSSSGSSDTADDAKKIRTIWNSASKAPHH